MVENIYGSVEICSFIPPTVSMIGCAFVSGHATDFLRAFSIPPFFRIGSLLTCVALIAASNHLRKGNRTEFNRALRWRVGFQGITVVAAVGGSLYYGRAATNPDGPPAASSSGYGRPTTILQQSRTEARNVAEKAGLQERMAQAAEADQLESDAVERVAAQTQPKERPVIGQDRRI